MLLVTDRLSVNVDKKYSLQEIKLEPGAYTTHVDHSSKDIFIWVVHPDVVMLVIPTYSVQEPEALIQPFDEKKWDGSFFYKLNQMIMRISV